MKLCRTSERRSFGLLAATRSIQAAIMTLQPGQSSGELGNEHPSAEQWLLVLNGVGRAVVGKRRIALRRHALLLIEKGEVHQINNDGTKPLHTLSFYAPPAYTPAGDVRREAKRPLVAETATREGIPMRYHVLASDYDGTLAHHGRVDEPTVAALEKLLATGRRLVLVTGRELPELLSVFPQIDLFELVVAENGALLYRPGTKEEKLLAEAPPERFVERLRQRGVQPISVGRSIVATWEPHENTVLETIRDLGLELQVIFNKGAVMVLPAGVSKASGLTAALQTMGLSAHNAVAVGDAENDHALLRLCEVSVAVANALPSLKGTADYVTKADHGAGVAELIAAIVGNDLKEWEPRLTRHHLTIGKADGAEVALPPYGPPLLIAGPSASGKSTVAATILDALATQKYQFCIIDPEGDYETLEHATVLGGPTGRPVTQEVLQLLKNPEQNLVVSLTGMPIPDRPPFFLDLLPKILQLRAQTGRPHWLILDEAHHLMPADWKPPTGVLPEAWHNAVLITVHPELLAAPLLERVGTFLNVGPDASETLKSAAAAVKLKLPPFMAPPLNMGDVLLWSRERDPVPRVVKTCPSHSERRRHRRKYAEGELPPERSFYFKGPAGKLNLRAQNLMMFLQIADGVDDETWEHHLNRGDYSGWFRDSIKDEALAADADRIAADANLTAGESRQLMRNAIERDYTQPASRPLPVPGAFVKAPFNTMRAPMSETKKTKRKPGNATTKAADQPSPTSILVIDIGGTKVKMLATGETEPRKMRSGKTLTPNHLVDAVKDLAVGWKYEGISIGYPGQVGNLGPRSEPGNLGPGWVGFNFGAAFGMPVRIINDAAMQALGSYEGGRMLFLGLGTGLGSALIIENVIVPLELGQLRFNSDENCGDVLGRKGLKRVGKLAWRKAIDAIVMSFTRAFEVDHIVLGGGNAKNIKKLPPGCRLGHNLTAFRGGFRLWNLEDITTLSADGEHQPPTNIAAAEWRVM